MAEHFKNEPGRRPSVTNGVIERPTEYKLASARWALLQSLVEGLRCVNPDRFQSDCGKCGVCQCKYSDGSLVGYDLGGRSHIPGTEEMKARSEALWADLDLARERAGARR